MAVQLHIQNNLQVVMPVRLTRAVTGIPVIDAPDLDDRGYDMPRPAGWNSTQARGPMFGFMAGDTVRIKLEREDLDNAAPLFATVSAAAANQIEIIDPPNSTTAIAANGIIQIKGVAATTSGQKLEIRYQSATGPIIAEAEPHVFSPLTLNVTAHVCTIHSAAAAPGTGVSPTVGGNPINVAAIMNMVAAIWRTAGIRIRLASSQNNTYFNFTQNDFARWNRAGGPGTESRILTANFVANTCNIYFIRYMDNSLGVGVNRDGMAAEGFPNPGIIIGVEGYLNATGAVVNRTNSGLVQQLANDVAHEIGHFLTLQHAGQVNAPGLRHTYARRQLMHPVNTLPVGSPVNDTGYGTVPGGAHRGCLITSKQYPDSVHRRDGDIGRARARFRSPNLY